ncbi:hypothetical protein [uncultured Enterococcus sp.]|uniref:hypothetical protein n=1 Tax=uncultured Enterococcus sp. TaxID=167972 RepID=UPI002AA7E9F4|nr:hypothetical protein [uncultured Enterococcus sp.]
MKKRIYLVVNFIFGTFSKYFIWILLCAVVVGMLISTSYYIPDKAVFRANTLLDYFSFLIVSLFIILGFFLIDKLKIKPSLLLSLYFIAGTAFILLVPLEPFSDMGAVYTIARNGFHGNTDYLVNNSNNIFTTMVMFILLRINDSFVTLKFVQLLANLLICVMSYQIFRHLFPDVSINKSIFYYFFLLNFSVFLYINHVYNDILATAFTVGSIYALICFDFSNNAKLRSFQILIVSVCSFYAYSFRPNCLILLIAILIYLFFTKRMLDILILLISWIGLAAGFSFLSAQILPETKEQFPIWSFLQMGIDKDSLGFQNGSHATSWQSNDFFSKLTEFSLTDFIKFITKKNFWLWTEGTYQARRYAIGYPEETTFAYETFITKQLYSTTAISIIEKLQRSYYFITMLFAAVGTYHLNPKNKESRILLHLIIGFVIFYTFWELKSRYIYTLYPIFSIFALYGVAVIQQSRQKYTNRK